MNVKLYMDKVSEEMKILIEDMTEAQKLISNPQDVLDFNSAIEGERKINGLKIYEAITMAYNFSSALSYRLQEGGELSGQADSGPEETNQPAEAADKDGEKKSDRGHERRKVYSDELDDMLCPAAAHSAILRERISSLLHKPGSRYGWPDGRSCPIRIFF